MSYKELTTMQLLKQLWRVIEKRRRIQISYLLILLIFAAVAELVSIGAVLPFLTVLITPNVVFEHSLLQPIVQALGIVEPNALRLPFTVIFIVAAIIAGGARLLLLVLQLRISYAIGHDLSTGIYRRTLYQPYLIHVARNTSEIVSGMTRKVDIVVTSSVLPILMGVSASFILITILIALFIINPLITMLSFFGFGSIYLVIAVFSKRRLSIDSLRITTESDQVIKAMQEGLGGIRDVLLSGTQEAYSEIYRSSDLRLRRSAASVHIVAGGPRFVIEALGMVLIAALAFFLMSSSESGLSVGFPVLGVFALGAQRLFPVLQQIYSGWSSIRGSQESLRDVLVLYAQPMPEDRQASAPIEFRKSIVLDNVSFRYGSRRELVLHALDIEIPKGSRIGVVGTTGSGKSTLLDIVMGLIHPTEGALRVDGAVVTSENDRAWQAHISHVPQSVFLADATIAENIAFGVTPDQIDYGRIRKVAGLSQISETIESWEKKYDTRVGERGIGLSGGERQRIGIARALYKPSDVLIFDEATSALDDETERAVIRALDDFGDGLTVFFVAHRLTTLRSCSQVIQIVDGRIERSGDYEDVIRSIV